ncbi:formylglycine-generating enzyme [Gammaproteobacteria bacterium]
MLILRFLLIAIAMPLVISAMPLALAANCPLNSRQVQGLLAHEGYDPGVLNGSLTGQKTRAALKQYQRTQGLTETGVLDPTTCERLRTTAAEASPPAGGGTKGAPNESASPSAPGPSDSFKDANLQEATSPPPPTPPHPIPPTVKPKIRNYGAESLFRHPIQDGPMGPEMILIPPGCLAVGAESPHPPTHPVKEADSSASPSPSTKEEKQDEEAHVSPTVLTCLGEFALSRYEVTFEEYDRFAQATNRRLPNDAGFGRGRQPVIDVTWEDATAYAAWLAERTGESYRLPTETEWEYAARAGTDRIWPWGDELGMGQAVCRSCGTPWDFRSSAPVGNFPANSWGINDLGGNVWEWTCSPFVARSLFLGLFYSVQPPREGENKCAEPGKDNAWVMRGGSWFNLPEQLHNTYRTGQSTDYRYKTVGFRVAWSETKSPITHLTLKVTPPDAQIRLLNPERLGTANMELPSGRYHLRVEKPGFISFDNWTELTQLEQELRIDLKSLTRLTTQLPDSREPEHPISTLERGAELPKSRLTVQTDPADAKVTLLDPERPYTPTMELPRGRYRILAQAPSHESVEQTVELGQTGTTLAISLPWIEPVTNMVFIRVPAGSFQMGSPANESNRNAAEGPVHTVNITSFLIGKYDVTFDQWDACVAARGCSYRPFDQSWGRGNRPVINVSWFDAEEFAAWLSYKSGRKYRLPTESEWEYTMRAGTMTTYWWGNGLERIRANCDGCGSQWDNTQTAPAGSFSSNPWGLFDMTGNVWKWMCSIYANSYDGTENRCVGKDNRNLRSLRGGSWYNLQHWMRSAARYREAPDNRNSYTGFRLIGTSDK